LGLAVGGAMAPSAERAARGQGSESGAGDSGVVLLQAIGLTLAATEGVKTLVPRHRPFASFAPAGRSEPWRASGDAAASFWSGHAALAFAAAAVGSFDACGAESRLGCAAPAVALHSLAASAAMMRVLAGRHHVSDVVAGGVVGGAVGSAVALAHAPAGRRPATDAGHAVMAGQGLALTMFFLW
jgi:undecaprenyl-diphosphatase